MANHHVLPHVVAQRCKECFVNCEVHEEHGIGKSMVCFTVRCQEHVFRGFKNCSMCGTGTGRS